MLTKQGQRPLELGRHVLSSKQGLVEVKLIVIKYVTVLTHSRLQTCKIFRFWLVLLASETIKPIKDKRNA